MVMTKSHAQAGPKATIDDMHVTEDAIRKTMQEDVMKEAASNDTLKIRTPGDGLSGGGSGGSDGDDVGEIFIDLRGNLTHKDDPEA